MNSSPNCSKNRLAKGQPKYASWFCRSNVGAVQGLGKLSGPKGQGLSPVLALAIILHLLYLLEKVGELDQEDMSEYQSYCSSVPVTAKNVFTPAHGGGHQPQMWFTSKNGQIPLYPGGQGADCRTT